MIYFPDWSDLGNISSEQREFWEGELEIRSKFFNYYTGAVFKERIEDVENISGDNEDAPLMYPVGVNLVRMMCLAQADALFGEWDESIVQFMPKDDENEKEKVKKAIDILHNILHSSDMNSALWEIALDGQIYGGGVMKITANLSKYGSPVKWSRVPLNNFFPIFDPNDPNRIMEAYVVTPMTMEQAKDKFGFGDHTGNDIVNLVEHWTETRYETRIEDRLISTYSGLNPWGIVPFVYIPRYRTHHVWGASLTEEISDIQDELNARLADLSESINYNSHPVRWGRNLPKNFNEKNFPISPNSMWNLGRQIGDGPIPEVGMLNGAPVPESSFKYVNFLYDFSRVSTFSPPIVFGEDSGGGQRSGNTLEIRMLPLVRQTRRMRSYVREGLRRAIFITGLILKQKQFPGIQTTAIDPMLAGDITVSFAEVLPRDHQQIVDEVVKLFSMKVPGISIYTAVKKLGLGAREIDLIKEMLKDEELFPEEEEEVPGSKTMQKSNDTREALEGKKVPQTEVD
jgi:hypothetical protein